MNKQEMSNKVIESVESKVEIRKKGELLVSYIKTQYFHFTVQNEGKHASFKQRRGNDVISEAMIIHLNGFELWESDVYELEDLEYIHDSMKKLLEEGLK